MGIKFFFSWLKGEFPHHFTNFQKTSSPDMNIDTFMIDLNGLFHTSAARVYQYGAYERKSLLRRPKNEVDQNEDPKLRLACFEDVCRTIEELVNVVKPKKRVVMCIDGVAPMSKQNQQRQRRYRGLVEDEGVRDRNLFDARCITPGTKFMDYLSKYIDWYIRKQITENDAWKKLEIIFSNEKVPGEGEHKLIDYIRKYGSDDETYCINALDADLVMLSLGTHKKRFYLLREELFDKSYDYAYLNVGSGLRNDLTKSVLFWEGSDERRLINDFILFSFLCGNDFLPNIPSISLIEKGMSTIIDMYKLNSQSCGHLTDENGDIIKTSFQLFLSRIGQCEKSLLEEKFIKKEEYIVQDSLLNKYTKKVDDHYELDFENYRDEVYKKYSIEDLDDACHSYVDGCAWVLSYYLKGVKDWSYVYKYNYSPFAYDLTLLLTSYTPKKIVSVGPIPMFLQLLCVIPPTSANLLPSPLNSVLTNRVFSKYFPTSFHINYEGKKKKWEGVVELPAVDVAEIRKEYTRLLPKVHVSEAQRNVLGKSYTYKYSEEFSTFIRSYYGSFTSFCVSESLAL